MPYVIIWAAVLLYHSYYRLPGQLKGHVMKKIVNFGAETVWPDTEKDEHTPNL